MRKQLDSHKVSKAYELGWGNLENGALLQQAESHGFEVLVTTEQNLRYQQNLGKRKIAVVVLSTTSWPRIQKSMPAIIEAIGAIRENGYVEIAISQGS